MRLTPQHTLRRVTPAIGAMLLFVSGTGPASAVPIGESRTGKMTWYDDTGYGACGTQINAATEDLVAVSYAWWTTANPNADPLCNGISVQVTYNGRMITVPVKDKCPGCPAEHIDLSKSAFQKLAPLDVGVVNGITWKFVSTSGGGGSDTQAPSAPSGLYSPSRTSSSVSLAWNASSDNIGVTGYDVYRGTTKVSTVTGTTATVSGLSPSTSYAFTVKARDAAGSVSAASNSLPVTTSAGSGGGGTCPTAWTSTQSYVPGDVVSYAGHKYTATYYSTGAVPNDPTSWAVWRDDGAC